MLCNCPKIGIVVPCFNEAARLPTGEFVRFCEQLSEISFCFVNDGSSDNTQSVLESLARELVGRASVINLEANKGKATGIFTGVKHVLSLKRFEFVGYWDVDLSTPLSEITKFVEVLDRAHAVQFICGSRIRRMGAEIRRVWYRHYLGRVFATTASLVLGLPIYDTQCGAKIIKAELARKIFDEPFLSKWLFDVELLARTRLVLGEQKAKEAIFELPLENWEDKLESKLTLYNYITAPYGLMKIFRKYRRAYQSDTNVIPFTDI